MSYHNSKQLLEDFKTNIEGLSEERAEELLSEYGKNEIIYAKRSSWIVYLLKSFIDPFVLILLAIVVLSFFTDVYFASAGEKDFMTVIIISTMILISVLIKFFQEYKSQIKADSLKEMVRTTSSVKRAGLKAKEIDMRELVPGDIVYLAAGDLIPADLRIIRSKDLFINQSALTGESIVVEKYSQALENSFSFNIEDLNNICLMGTIVVSGTATGLVVETGNRTYFGKIARSISSGKGRTNFELGIESVSKALIKFMLIMVPIVFLVNGISKKNWIDAFLFSISIAVGLTPEMLPTIVSTNLAKGAISLSNKKIVVKRLGGMQNLGAMDILCTDKTGTLTLDKIVLEKYLDTNGREDPRVLRHGYLNSYFQTGLKNLMDLAVINKGVERGLGELNTYYEKVDEIPFDFERRRMSVVLKDKTNKRQLITKGAIEEMLSICSFVEIDNKLKLLDDNLEKRILATVTDLNMTGMRVLGVAQKNNIPDEETFSVADESEMILIGYMGFLDPAKDSSKSAIAALHGSGVDVKVLTGDNQYVTKKICEDVGIKSDHILLGQDIEKLDNHALASKVDNIHIFAKLSPMQKERIIEVLQEKYVVGFLGDGINDAQALTKSDVGISVDTAVDIAKESADMILLEKDLNVLETGVLEGRRVFGNIIKYIKMTVSSNFGNVFSVLVASAFLPFLPMLPIQLLVQNLIYSISQVAISWDHMDPEYLDHPQTWDANDIVRFMLYIGPISSIFDIATFLVLWHVFKYNSLEYAAYFQTGWFILGLLSQTLVVHLLRTSKIPFIESRAAAPVSIMTVLAMATGIILPFTYAGSFLGFVALPPKYFLWLIILLLGYFILTEAFKRIYIKKFKKWL